MGSKRRVWLFRGIAVLLPVVGLVVVELLLRSFGYGHDTSLFIRYPDNPAYWVMNKYASERYFSDTMNATQGSVEPFAVVKKPGMFRIFVLGESTTAGYPYFHNGSFDRWLEFRLMREHPEIHFEIVNVALTAVNSWTVLDFGRQVLDYQPDAVLIYVGHNEYYGALGVGSTSRFGGWRWLVKAMIQLRRLRLVQLMGRVFSGFRKVGVDVKTNLMQRMAADQEIAFGSAKFEAGLRQFEENMSELFTLTAEKGVPVFLSTVVSNERGLRPFVGSGGADSAFAAADSAYRAGDYAQAKRCYVRAKELDELRFRAPEGINKIILRLAAADSNVHLVDAVGMFEGASPNRVLGREVLLEHVHPNLFGYALLSEAFWLSMRRVGLLKGGREMRFDSLVAKMPVTAVDSLNGAYTIMMLKSRWPFNEAIPASFKRGNSVAEQLAGAIAVGRISWADAMNELYTYSMRTHDSRTALKAVSALWLEHPASTTYALYAGRLSFELGDSVESVFYFKQAYATDPSLKNLRSLYLLYMKMDEPQEAMRWLDSAMVRGGDVGMVSQLKTLTGQIIQLKARLAASPADEKILRQLAFDYHAAGAEEAAKRYLR